MKVRISRPEPLPVEVAGSAFISDRERARLSGMALGLLNYEPRLNGRGVPRRCLINGCDRLAMDGVRKQRCPIHYASYLHKSNGERAKPQCAMCGQRTDNVFRGDPCCVHCAAGILSAEDKALAEQTATANKFADLDNVEDMDQLKQWIKDYLL